LAENGFGEAIVETLREHPFGATRRNWIDEWEADPDSFDGGRLMKLVEAIGKGRFAQRLASHVGDTNPPEYIRRAIEFVVARV